MRCSVQSCANRATKKKNTGGHKITFHLFPKDPKHRAAWVEAVRIKNWQPSDTSVICSEHFRKEDFYDTKKGARRIITGVVPQIPADLDEPAALRVCRICLALDVKMYNIKDFQLDRMYENITGITACDEVACTMRKLPARVCWECAARLKAAAAFRAKALLSDGLLHDLLKTEPLIIVGDIISMNQKYSCLKSSLVIQKVDTEEPNEKQQALVKTEEIDVPHNDAVETGEIETDVKRLVTEIIIKDEQNEVFIEEYEHFNKNEVKTEVHLVPTQFEISVGDSRDNSEDIHSDNDMVGIEVFEHEKKSHTEAMEVDEDSENDIFDDTNENTRITQNYNVAGTSKYKYKNTKVIKIVEIEDKVSNEVLKDNNEKIEVTSDVANAPKILMSLLAKKEMAKTTDGEMVRKIEAKRDAIKKPGPEQRRGKRPYVKPRQPIDEELFSITTLSVEQQLAEVQKRQDSNRYLIAPFKCTVCYKGFPTKDKYTRHALKHSEKSGSFQCGICKIRCKANWALRGHMARQHNEEYSCRQCPFLTRSRSVALEHIKFHAGRKFQCPQCATEFEKNTTLLNHLRLKHMSDAVCELCGYTFVSKIGVHAHKRLKHPLVDKDIKLEGPHCAVCDVIFLSRKAYDKHLRLSSKHIQNEDDPNRLSNDPSIKSRRIGAPFLSHRVRRPKIHGHVDVMITKPNEPVDCEQCGVVLQNLHAYTCHFKSVHPGSNRTKFPYMKTPYMCEQCGKMFLNTTLLNSHMWVHTGEKGFQCDHCKKWFSQKSNLAGHMRLHYGSPRPYECRVCGKLFTSASNRSRHMFLHTGLKPFKCEACEKCFPTTGELRAHVDHVHLKKPRPKRDRRRAKKGDMAGAEY